MTVVGFAPLWFRAVCSVAIPFAQSKWAWKQMGSKKTQARLMHFQSERERERESDGYIDRGVQKEREKMKRDSSKRTLMTNEWHKPTAAHLSVLPSFFSTRPCQSKNKVTKKTKKEPSIEAKLTCRHTVLNASVHVFTILCFSLSDEWLTQPSSFFFHVPFLVLRTEW